MSRNNGIVHSAITRQLLEKKLKKSVSASSLGGAVGDLQELTRKVEAVQSNLGSISATIIGLVNQVNLFQGITDNIQLALAELEKSVNEIIETALTKFSYLLEEGSEGIISVTVDDLNQNIYEVQNPFGNKDIIVQGVDEANGDEIVGVSVEIEQEKITLYLAHCEDEGQYRVILMG